MVKLIILIGGEYFINYSPESVNFCYRDNKKRFKVMAVAGLFGFIFSDTDFL